MGCSANTVFLSSKHGQLEITQQGQVRMPSVEPDTKSMDAEVPALRAEDFEMKNALGKGACGMVFKAYHVPTKTVMALKCARYDDKEQRRQMTQEISSYLKASQSPFLVKFYGAYADIEQGKIFMGM